MKYGLLLAAGAALSFATLTLPPEAKLLAIVGGLLAFNAGRRF